MNIPTELQQRLDRLNITWGWSALLVAPLCFGIGIGCFIGAWTGPWTALWEENYVYQPSHCVILEHKLSFLDTPQGRASRPELLIEYQWEGVQYKLWTYRRDTLLGDAYIRPRPSDSEEGIREVTPEQAQAKAQNVLNRYPINSTQPCWVNKNDPSKAILRKWRYVAAAFAGLAFGILAFVSGGLSLYHLVGKLHDRRHLLKRFAENPEGWDHGKVYPHRLEITAESRGQRLGGVFAIALWTTFSLIAVVAFWERQFHLGLAVAILFAWMGVGWFVSECWKFLFNRTGITEVEIDLQPLEIAQQGRVHVMQDMPLNVDQYKIAVRCRELTTFTAGSTTRTDSKEVYRLELHDDSTLSVSHWESRLFAADFLLPEGVPVSFKSKHNEIRWAIVVEGFRRGQLNFEREFPFEVVPAGNPGG